MDKLKEEIEKKRQAIKQLSGGNKYVRQSDIIAAKERAQRDAQEELDRERESKKPRLSEAVADLNHSIKLGDSAQIASKLESTADSLTVEQVKRQLRNLGEPITLFGESENDRKQRLIATLQRYRYSDQQIDDFRLDTLPNSFLKGQQHIPSIKSALHDNDEGHNSDEEEDEEGHNSDDDDNVHLPTEKETTTSKPKQSKYLLNQLTFYSRDTSLDKEKVVIKYFKTILKQWEWDLNARPDFLKLSAKGKSETKTQKQCKDYIRYVCILNTPYCDDLSHMLIHTLSTHRPLFKQCKRKEVEPDILLALFEMVKECESGDFMKANDHYLRCAIGTS